MRPTAKKDKQVVTPYVYDHFLPDYDPNRVAKSQQKNRDMSDKKPKALQQQQQQKQQQTSKSLNKIQQFQHQSLSQQIKKHLAMMQKCEKQQYIIKSQKQFKKFIDKEVQRLKKLKKQPKLRDNELTISVIHKQNEIICQLNVANLLKQKQLNPIQAQFGLAIQCIGKISKAYQDKNSRELETVKKKIVNKEKLQPIKNLIEILAQNIAQEKSKSVPAKPIPGKNKQKELQQQLKTLKINYNKAQQQQSRLEKLVQKLEKQPYGKAQQTDLQKDKKFQLQIQNYKKKIKQYQEQIKKKNDIINQYEINKKLSDTKINSSTKSIKTEKDIEINDTLNDFMEKALPVLNSGETWEGMFLDFKRRYHRNSLVVFLEAIFRRQRSFQLKIAQLEAKLASIRNNSQSKAQKQVTQPEPEPSKIDPKNQKQLKNYEKLNQALQKIIASINKDENWSAIVNDLKKTISKSTAINFLQLILKKNAQRQQLHKTTKEYQTIIQAQQHFLTEAVESFNKNKEWQRNLNEYKKISQRNTLIVFLQILNKQLKALQLKVKQVDKQNTDKKASQQTKRANDSLQRQKNALLKQKQKLEVLLQEVRNKLLQAQKIIQEKQVKIKSYAEIQATLKNTNNSQQELESINKFIDSLIKISKIGNWDKQLTQYRKSHPRSPIVNFLDMISRNEKNSQTVLKKLENLQKKSKQQANQNSQLQKKLQQYQKKSQIQANKSILERQNYQLKEKLNTFQTIIKELQKKLENVEKLSTRENALKSQITKIIEVLKSMAAVAQKSSNQSNQLANQLKNYMKKQFSAKNIKQLRDLCNQVQNLTYLISSKYAQRILYLQNQLKFVYEQIEDITFSITSQNSPKPKLQSTNVLGAVRILKSKIKNRVSEQHSKQQQKLRKALVQNAQLFQKYNSMIKKSQNQKQEIKREAQKQLEKYINKFQEVVEIKKKLQLQKYENQVKHRNIVNELEMRNKNLESMATYTNQTHGQLSQQIAKLQQKLKSKNQAQIQTQKMEVQIQKLKQVFQQEKRQMILQINQLVNQRNSLQKTMQADKNNYRAKINELYAQLQKQTGAEKQAADFKKLIDKLKVDKQQAERQFEQQKSQLKKYITKVNNDLQTVIISNNEQKKKIRLELEQIRQEEYNTQSQKIKKLKEELNQQSQKNKKLIYIIQSNETSFNGLVEENKSLFQKVLNAERMQQELKQELQICQSKLAESLEIIDELLPLQHKVKKLQKVLQGKVQSQKLQISIKQIQQLEKENKFLSEKYNEIIYESDNKVNELKRQFEQLKHEHSFTLTQIKNKQQSIIHLNTIIKSAQKQSGPFNELLLKYERQLQENAQLKGKLLSASKQSQTQESITQLIIKIQFLQQNIAEKERDMQQIRKQLNNSRFLVEEKNSKIETLMSQIYYLKVMIIQKQKTIETNHVLSKIEKDRFTSENDSLSKQLSRIKTKAFQKESFYESVTRMESQKQVIN